MKKIGASVILTAIILPVVAWAFNEILHHRTEIPVIKRDIKFHDQIIHTQNKKFETLDTRLQAIQKNMTILLLRSQQK